MMISARLFRLYRLASPIASSASKKILEPTLRRVAVSCPDASVAAALNKSVALSWTRYCATTTDKEGDVKAAENEAAIENAESSADSVAAADAEVTKDAAASIDDSATATDPTPAESINDKTLSSAEPSAENDAAPSAEPSASEEPAATVESIETTPASPESSVDSSATAAAEAEAAPSSPPSPPAPPPVAAGLHVHALTDRALIRIEGVDTQALLQGLVTQDLELLNQSPSVYAMMLNLQGRVLYDVIIYNASSPRSEVQKYLLECDASVAPDIVSHLKKYKLRKNCDIVDVSDVYEVSSVRPTTERMASLSSLPRKSEFAEAFDPILIACRDPRLKDIGWRLISGKGFEVSEALGGGAVSRPLVEYREQRYKLGVAEGIHDLEPGKTFPLESNLVFLNGVSFSKGCYLGQELTARTHHTGVIRKRIMPLILSAPISAELGPFSGNLILNTAGKDAGKFRDAVGVHGIGLVRVNMSGGRLIVVGKGRESECYARMPHWWPVDDPAAVLGDEEEEPGEEAAAGEKSAQTSS